MQKAKGKIQNRIMVILAILVLGTAIVIAGCSSPAEVYKIGDKDLAVSINPNPPKAGDNVLKIKLTDVSGKAIKNAEIEVVYSMPAMGNMSAMVSKVKALSKGDGYEVIMSFPMLGTWTIRIKAEIVGHSPIIAELKVTTGQKGIIYVSGSSDEKGMEMEMHDGPVVKLTKDQEELARVKTEPARVVSLFNEIRTVGIVAYDPLLVVAEEEFVSALEARDKMLKSSVPEIRENSESLVRSSRRKLRIMGLSEGQISDLEETRKVDTNLLLPEETMWVYADVYEYELSWVKAGQKVLIRSVAFPGRDFRGIIKAVEPILDSKTRSAKLRVEVNNPGLLLKPQMYVDVFIKSSPKYVLAVPKEAVLDTGIRKVVYVSIGNGRFIGKNVETGAEGFVLIKGEKMRFYPVHSGITKGERVVTSANFLIDSQSQLTGGSSSLYGGAKEINDR